MFDLAVLAVGFAEEVGDVEAAFVLAADGLHEHHGYLLYVIRTADSGHTVNINMRITGYIWKLKEARDTHLTSIRASTSSGTSD
ncbi:MAG: hypothetical protein AB1700_05550 [Bacillota bacterium]